VLANGLLNVNVYAQKSQLFAYSGHVLGRLPAKDVQIAFAIGRWMISTGEAGHQTACIGCVVAPCAGSTIRDREIRVRRVPIEANVNV
jgi:hypothetical protein